VYAEEHARPVPMVAKKHYSVRETYWLTHDAAVTIRHFARLRVRSPRVTERIMLAVTEVNGCALCAYGHTRFALGAGLTNDEIRDLLGGGAGSIPDAELPAVAFAQHCADQRGRPEHDVWSRLVDTYGEEQALGVLGTARMIMCGNAIGIPWSSLLSRLRGAPHPDSSLRYEIGTIAGSALLMPVAVVHAQISAFVIRLAPETRHKELEDME
jgi:AhpD family alkylhydroperoxidase